MNKKILLPLSFLSMAIFFVMLYLHEYTWVKTVFKALPVIIFAWLIGFEGRYRTYISIGLLFSALGDILLDEYLNLFVPGLAAFLIAHVFYIIAFIYRSKRPAVEGALAIYSIGGIAFTFLYKGVGELLIPVLLYMAVITTMGWRAYAARRYDSYAQWAFYGALLFIASDSLIAFNKFYTPVPYHGWLIMLTYWAAQYLIFKSAYQTRRKNQKS